MNSDELASPGYAVLGATTKTKLDTLARGQLMVRNPPFAQPNFARLPRPAVLSARGGDARFPPGDESSPRVLEPAPFGHPVGA